MAARTRSSLIPRATSCLSTIAFLWERMAASPIEAPRGEFCHLGLDFDGAPWKERRRRAMRVGAWRRRRASQTAE